MRCVNAGVARRECLWYLRCRKQCVQGYAAEGKAVRACTATRFRYSLDLGKADMDLIQGSHEDCGCRGRQKSMLVDFEALGPVPKDKLRQAKAACICLKTAPSKADTLLPEDHHYQACLCSLPCTACMGSKGLRSISAESRTFMCTSG